MPGWAELLVTYSAGPVVALFVTYVMVADQIESLFRQYLKDPTFAPFKEKGYSTWRFILWHANKLISLSSLLPVAAFLGIACAIPVAGYTRSTGLFTLTFIGSILTVVTLTVYCSGIVVRGGSDPLFATFELSPNLVSEANRERLSLDRAGYVLRCGLTLWSGALFGVTAGAFGAYRLGSKPGVVAILALLLALVLGACIPLSAYKFFLQRRYLVLRAAASLSDALKAEPDREPLVTAPHPLRFVDPGISLRRDLAKAATRMTQIGRRIAVMNMPGVVHPLAVMMWSASDEITAYLKSPTSLSGVLPDRLTGLLEALVAVMAGPKDDVSYKVVVPDDAAFDADWSKRIGGLGSRVSARFVTTVEHMEQAKKGTLALVIVVMVFVLLALSAIGRVDWAKTIANIFGVK